MPHDKNGQILTEGDEVLLRCKLLNVSPGAESQCNVTAEAIERPEGEAYIPQIAGNSKFYEKRDPERTAGVMYAAYCEAVGGKAFNGDPLPAWQEFRADPSKQKQSFAWVAAADAAM